MFWEILLVALLQNRVLKDIDKQLDRTEKKYSIRERSKQKRIINKGTLDLTSTYSNRKKGT